MQNLFRLSLCRRIVILLAIAAHIQVPLSICEDMCIDVNVVDANQNFLELRRTWQTFPEEKRWHPFTVSKTKGLRSGGAGRWDWDKDCFTFLISTRHRALSSPEGPCSNTRNKNSLTDLVIFLHLRHVEACTTSSWLCCCWANNWFLTIY